MTVATRTGSITDRGPDERIALPPVLVRALDCNRPLRGSHRFPLQQAAQVLIGRGTVDRQTSREGDTLHIALKDRLLSSQHLRLVQLQAGWRIEDVGSKNGTFVNGTKLRQPTQLNDGDVIEAGSTIFVYRDEVLVDSAVGTHLQTQWHRPNVSALATSCQNLSYAFFQLTKIAASEQTVMICGDTGTGKELTARAVHELSGRSGPFVAVNCGALPPTLIESELFGARKGAYSGATEERPGWVRAAHRGTLFLDEIAELSDSSQVALLRVLQESEVVPVGATTPIPVDVRFIAATHQNLATRIGSGQFREDLYARLTAFQVTLPPLRSRREDIGQIVASILRDAAGEHAEKIRFRPAAGRALFCYSWPRNIRELDNALRSALVLACKHEVALPELPSDVRMALDGTANPVAVDFHDASSLRELLVELYQRHQGNVSAVARELGKARAQVQRWNRRFGLNPAVFRD